jgi:hypothetical protein
MKNELTAEALELYCSHPLANEAVAAIEAAFGQAIKAMGEGMKKGAAYNKFVGPVMNQYAQAGASDSEARYAILDAFNARF